MLSSLTLETLARKKHKEAKEASISFRSIIFVKKYILSLFQSNSKTLTKKKKSFRFLKVLQDLEVSKLIFITSKTLLKFKNLFPRV